MALNYSNLMGNTDFTYDAGGHGLQLTSITYNKRLQLKSLMDDFTGFTGRGIDAFRAFGAFIINNKDTLKFYNGPTYSNEYTKPMFESAAGQLTGVTFQTQKIDFTIGVYGISEQHYREMIYWLHPYEVNTLTFDFEPDYFYQVKLASVENGVRRVIGSEMVNGKKEYRYYTEIKLTFEVQGDACAYRKQMYELLYLGNSLSSADNTSYSAGYGLRRDMDDDESETSRTIGPNDIDTPITVYFKIHLDRFPNNIPSDAKLQLKFKAQYYIGDNPYTLDIFNTVLANLPYYMDLVQIAGTTSSNNQTTVDYTTLTIKYDSLQGLLYVSYDDSEYYLLNRLFTLTNGKRLVESMNVNMYHITGQFIDPEFDITKLYFGLEGQGVGTTPGSETYTEETLPIESIYEIRARTNLI